MKTPNLREKVKMYESYLHKINSFIICCDNEGIAELVNNADNWSYSHRVGNGELSDRKQQQAINNAFWRLCDTPKSDIATKKRQKVYVEHLKKEEKKKLFL